MTVFDVVHAEEAVEAVLIIADEADWLDECQFMLHSLGLPSHGARTATDALAKLANRSVATVIIDHDLPGHNCLELVEELSAQAMADGHELRFIMATDHATLDDVVAAMRLSVVDILQKPITRDDLRNALLRVHGVRPKTAVRKALASQLTSLSLEIQRLSGLMDNQVPPPRADPIAKTTCPGGNITSDFIRDLIRREARRSALFNGRLFGDPAWTMLLDLLAAKLDGREVSVSSACIASGAPTTTALRLINRLVGENVLERIPDVQDRRRDFIQIAPDVEGPLLAHLNTLANG